MCKMLGKRDWKTNRTRYKTIDKPEILLELLARHEVVVGKFARTFAIEIVLLNGNIRQMHGPANNTRSRVKATSPLDLTRRQSAPLMFEYVVLE